MKKISTVAWTVSLIAILVALFSADASAIRRAGGQGWDANTMYGSLFDPATIEDISGEVLSIEPFTPFRRMGTGYLVMLKTSDSTIPVHVGPAWYVDQQTFQIEPGDTLQITGSRIEYNGSPAIMAMKVTKGDQVLVLRNAQGIPAWSSAED